jgi:hypothetical protein
MPVAFDKLRLSGFEVIGMSGYDPVADIGPIH